MTESRRSDPCLDPPVHLVLPGPPRVRVVEVMATGTSGGAQEHLYNLLSRIDRTRYEVSVVSLSAGVAVRRLARLGIQTLVIDDHDDEIAAQTLASQLAASSPDIVHNHMYRAEVVGTKGVMAMARAGHRRPYVVSTIHSSRVRSTEDRTLVASLTREMDRLIAVSRTIVDKVADERGSSVPVSLVYNGIDLDRYDHQEPCCTLREEYGMEPSARIVGVVARLEVEKGHRTLFEAWPLVLRRCPDAYLLVVGEGSQRAALESVARDLRIAHRVVFAGRRDDVPAVTAALDVSVLPSYREAQGLAVLEAMALSRPVVATAVGGIVEMIDDGVTGLLVPPHEPESLAAAIARLLADNPLADTIARRAHDMVHDRFCVELMVKAIEEIYDEGARSARMPTSAVG
ncbi:MAG TPA: glycosyltransferase [Candidatus Limnocylindrales bacterium]|nr:glycosyltransferase [Candidatus Limnocylindrales bacterium]